MANSDQPPMRDEIIHAGDDGQYLVWSRMEIARILQAIMDKKEAVTACFLGGEEFIASSILAVNPDGDAVVMEFGANKAANKQLLESDKITIVSFHDKVKVQFVAVKAEDILFEKRSAFKIKFPKALLKLQRRGNYRLLIPAINPLKCVINHQDYGRVVATILDISLSGIGVIGYPPEIDLKPGTLCENCGVVFPESDTVFCSLEICYTSEAILENGTKIRRSGCRFIALPADMQTLIQRYIVKLASTR